MNIESLATRAARALEGAGRLDPPADRLNELVARYLPVERRGWIAGTWLGHPAHPFLVSVPIGCWTSASLLDAFGQRQAARMLIGAGVLSVIPTAVTGLSDWADTSGAERRVGFVHLAVNAVATSTYAASWLARRHRRHALGVALAVLGAGVASGGGWLGGHLAYALGVGVDTNAFDAGPVEWTTLDVQAPEDGTPVRSAIGPTPLLVSRQDVGVRVIADRCSHRGAPLSDGQVAEGCVTCPWHGSRFSLATGEVRRGPAVVPQPTYETRETDGVLEIRRDEPRALRTNSAHP
jgi:nitrite reductase/ring-hydroxylating ferredoxin subunit/uncharacterized membrane protein